MANNVFGDNLETCSEAPLTGFYRDGCCNTDALDRGTHTVCAIMTEEFLKFTKTKGNDLSTPRPAYQFPGLKPGDRWCLCVTRWLEAKEAGLAPPVVLESTHEKTLQFCSLDILIQFAYKKS